LSFSRQQLFSAMPIYEFHCAKCGQDNEVLVRSSQWQGAKCPHCGSTKLEKKLSVFASSGGGAQSEPAACGGNPGSCGCRCSGGGRHRH
jgi:putative FmdB family regulatory protein